MSGKTRAIGCMDAFKQAMRGVAGTVAIVTASEDGQPVGMAATSFCSVSMEPPSLLVCVNKAASMLQAMRQSRRLCLNILQSDNHAVCSYFGGQYAQEERFKFHAWSATAEGLPFLKDAQAVVVGTIVEEIPHGTHTVFIANVEDVYSDHPSPDPLLYVNGGYAKAVCLTAA